MIRPFLVLGLPRSRTAWLARFLSYREWHCGHEELRHIRHLDDAEGMAPQPFTGSAETAAAPFWRLFGKLAADLRVVVVRRDPGEVIRSMLAIPMNGEFAFDEQLLTALIKRFDCKLDQIVSCIPNVLEVSFTSLMEEMTCAMVFQHCLPYQHDHEWWKLLAPLNLQASMSVLMRYMTAYKPQIDRAAGMAKQAMLNDLALRPVKMAGMTFQTERFVDWYNDASNLLGEHLLEVGEPPMAHATKNLPLLTAIDDAGQMQIVTARSNGRMFGYLMTEIAPSRESTTTTWAVNTAFFASAVAPGLGMKLQREALRRLRDRGVNEVFFRAGPRGAGPKMGPMFRRLGAESDGELYRLRFN